MVKDFSLKGEGPTLSMVLLVGPQELDSLNHIWELSVEHGRDTGQSSFLWHYQLYLLVFLHEKEISCSNH